MGFLRKTISGSLAVITNGLSLPLVQFRSDTERGTRQTKLLRLEMERQHKERLQFEREQMQTLLSEASSSNPSLSVPVQTVWTSRKEALVGSVSDPRNASNTPTLISVLESIDRLAALRDHGTLTEEEFRIQKESLLKSIDV